MFLTWILHILQFGSWQFYSRNAWFCFLFCLKITNERLSQSIKLKPPITLTLKYAQFDDTLAHFSFLIFLGLQLLSCYKFDTIFIFWMFYFLNLFLDHFYWNVIKFSILKILLKKFFPSDILSPNSSISSIFCQGLYLSAEVHHPLVIIHIVYHFH